MKYLKGRNGRRNEGFPNEGVPEVLPDKLAGGDRRTKLAAALSAVHMVRQLFFVSEMSATELCYWYVAFSTIYPNGESG